MAATLDQPSDAGLVVEGLTKTFGERQVVRGVSLTLARGEVVGLLGPNGAGKTTCFYMITGLIPVDQGSISLDGRDITALPMYQRARMGLGYLPQEASIFRGMTVEENVLAVVEMRESDPVKARATTAALLEELHIAHLKASPAVSLSGGERRRVEIARALAAVAIAAVALAGGQIGRPGVHVGVSRAVGHGVDGIVGGRRLGLDRFGLGIGIAFVTLQQRIALELGLDIGLQLKVGQLQQLDRLLQLRRDHKALALSQLQSWTERHALPPVVEIEQGVRIGRGGLTWPLSGTLIAAPRGRTLQPLLSPRSSRG